MELNKEQLEQYNELMQRSNYIICGLKWSMPKPRSNSSQLNRITFKFIKILLRDYRDNHGILEFLRCEGRDERVMRNSLYRLGVIARDLLDSPIEFDGMTRTHLGKIEYLTAELRGANARKGMGF